MSEIIKCNANGSVIWRRRTIQNQVLISPFNGDIFYRDHTMTGRHAYCLHQAPVARPDSMSVLSGTKAAIDVALNDDYSVDAAYSITTPPAVGQATITANGILRYSAPPGASGLVTLKYEARKFGLTPAANIPVTILIQ